MQYDAASPKEYLENLDTDWRKEKLVQVRDLINTHGKDLTEYMEYKMLAFGYNEKAVFHLNAQRAYVSLYVGNIEKVERAREMLDGLDIGKGCIRIKKSVNIGETKLEGFIKKTIDLRRKGGDTDC
jgi:uncharacterized protein YdhG (YjbR/CyaY superfamily)